MATSAGHNNPGVYDCVVNGHDYDRVTNIAMICYFIMHRFDTKRNSPARCLCKWIMHNTGKEYVQYSFMLRSFQSRFRTQKVDMLVIQLQVTLCSRIIEMLISLRSRVMRPAYFVSI